MPDRPPYVFVLSPSRLVFENACIVDWKENPKDRKFIVFTNSTFRSSSHGRRWQEDDELRIVARHMIDPEMFEAMWYIFVTMGAPQVVMDQIGRSERP